ncbi:uncharacterized protein LOC111386315 [Olea europaea var. sylvestris]|uniref:Uncharacterized protein n=1 Tax=Olea europaea subsp. europaea TaxID=158383 RepID=A0A8S0R582_OLEEU|nr:uncharacterized protein LOC111386315 [Olea europaea var. sylvestris]CAA2974453.1 Hypothetical predicted protein [Olea europaea subsp. europaea]
MEEVKVKKRGRDGSEEETVSVIDLPEVKRLREELLDSLGDDDSELCTESQDLDSFMKSFEEEIMGSPSPTLDLKSGPEESQPDLEYLLEASDHELGLPPSTGSPVGVLSDEKTELGRVSSDSSELGGELWEFPSYDSYEFGIGGTDTYSNSSNGEYVALDELFDYSDMGFGFNDFEWKPELPAQ